MFSLVGRITHQEIQQPAANLPFHGSKGSAALLGRLYELDRSSPGFPEQLGKLLHDEQWIHALRLIPEGELEEPMRYLDNVRFIPTPAEPTNCPQILDILDPTDLSFRKCLDALQEVCSDRMILPSTYEVSGEISFATSSMAASGSFCDVYQGTLGHAKVAIKRLRIGPQDDEEKVSQVPHPRNV